MAAFRISSWPRADTFSETRGRICNAKKQSVSGQPSLGPCRTLLRLRGDFWLAENLLHWQRDTMPEIPLKKNMTSLYAWDNKDCIHCRCIPSWEILCFVPSSNNQEWFGGPNWSVNEWHILRTCYFVLILDLTIASSLLSHQRGTAYRICKSFS